MPKKKTKSKRLLMIGPFPDPVMGMSVANEVLYNSLLKKGHEVDRINTAMYAFDEKPGAFSFGKLFHFLKPNIYFYKVFRAKAVYVTPGQTFFGVSKYSVFFWLCSLLGKELVLHIHSNIIHKEYESNRGWKKRYMGFLLKRATKGIVLSPSLKNNLTPFLPEDKIFSVVNFVEPEFVANESQVREKQFDERRIIFLSNLMTKKGILYLFKALEEMEAKGIPYKARFAGDIDEHIKAEVSAYIEELKHVTFLGVVKGANKRALLDWGNTFIFPSYLTEGLPLSILEAMATGNYIISTQHTALTDLFEEDSIRFIEKQSSEAIEQALIESSETNHLEIRLKNHRYVTENCSVERFTDSVLNVIFAGSGKPTS